MQSTLHTVRKVQYQKETMSQAKVNFEEVFLYKLPQKKYTFLAMSVGLGPRTYERSFEKN